MTIDQIQREFFHGKRAAYRRVTKLIDLRLMQSDPWLFNEPRLLRVTSRGASLVALGISPARIVPSQVNHSLKLVDLLGELEAEHPAATVTTEREIRGELHRARRAGERDIGRGRIPDGLLSFPDGKRIALELDLVKKAPRDYGTIIRAYTAEAYDHVWWFVPTAKIAERLRTLVAREYADHLITVKVWP